MSSTLVVIDNLIAGGTVSYSSQNANRPWSRSCDGDGSKAAQFAAAAANDYAPRVDLNYPSLDGFEGATFLWSDTSTDGPTNSAAQSTTAPKTGAKCMKLTYGVAGAAKYARGQIEIPDVPTGQRRNLTCALKGDGVLVTHLYVKIKECALYLDPGTLTWGTTPVDFASRSANAWDVTAALTFLMPNRATARRRRMTLQIVAYIQHAVTTGIGYVDDVFCWPSVDIVAVHSHDLGPVAIHWKSSDDAWGSEALVAAMTIAERRFYYRAAAFEDHRYQEILLDGTSHHAESFGQVLFGQALVLQESPGWDHETALDWPQVRAGSSGAALSDVRQETLSLPFEWTTDPALVEFVLGVWEACRGGVDPCWIVPLDDEPDILFCNFPQTLKTTRTFLARWKSAGIELVERPHVRWAGLS
jgi:hypothetical protein